MSGPNPPANNIPLGVSTAASTMDNPGFYPQDGSTVPGYSAPMGAQPLVPAQPNMSGYIDLLNELPLIRTKSAHNVIIPLAKRVWMMCVLQQQQQQNQLDQVRNVLLSGAVSTGAHSLLASVENMVHVATSLIKSEQQPSPSAEITQLCNAMQQACATASTAAHSMTRWVEAAVTSCSSAGPNAPGPGQEPSANHLASALASLASESRAVLAALLTIINSSEAINLQHIVATHQKVSTCLGQMESVNNFQQFVHLFGQFGTNMVQLAHASGPLQAELMREEDSAELSCCRAVLEKGTMMLLTASKTLLRHPECNSAQKTRDSVFLRVHTALGTFLSTVQAPPPTLDQATEPPGEIALCQMLQQIKSVMESCGNSGCVSQWAVDRVNEINVSLRALIARLFSPGVAAPAPEGGVPELTHVTAALDLITSTCQSYVPRKCANRDQMQKNMSAVTRSVLGQVEEIRKWIQSLVLTQCAQFLTIHADESARIVAGFKDAATTGNLHLAESETTPNLSRLTVYYQHVSNKDFWI